MSISIKLLTINMHKGFNHFNRQFILPELREAVRATDAEIVFLQEVVGEHTAWEQKHRSHWPEVPQYEYMADTLWGNFAYGKNAIYEEGHHGNALLCKYPLERWKNYDISVSDIERRGLLYAYIQAHGQPVHLLCTHLSLTEKQRVQQIAKIFSIVSQLPRDEPVVLAGDFNDWRLKIHSLCAAEGFHDVYADVYGTPARTFPASLPLLRLDRIYVRGVTAKMPVVLPGKPWSHLSDHRPLYAEIVI